MAARTPHGLPDYYAVLGVAPAASAAEIKRAYRKLARKYHPDVSSEPDAAERIKDVNEANEVLGDQEKRAKYDELLTAPPPRARTRRADGEAGEMFRDEFFRRFFFDDGEAGRGQDFRARLALTLEEAFTGSSQLVDLGRRKLRVKIPPGMLQDDVLRLREQGGPGQPPGDLHIAIDIAPHPRFRLVGADIHLDVPLAPWEAALGAKLAVPTLGGSVHVEVPAGQRAGSRLRLAGRGMPARDRRPAGHQYLHFLIDVPKCRGKQAHALYEELATLPHEALRDW